MLKLQEYGGKYKLIRKIRDSADFDMNGSLYAASLISQMFSFSAARIDSIEGF